MNLSKPRVDIGLSTNNLGSMLAFWQGEAGVPFDHLLPIRPGLDQHRHDVLGSVLKINHNQSPLPDAPASRYRELLIPRPGLAEPKALIAPDGNRAGMVPLGYRRRGHSGIRPAGRA